MTRRFYAMVGHAAGDWQLAEGHYIPAKLPMKTVFPRADSECNTWARQRKAYTGLKYEIPIGVAFGSWPFKYELISGPSGMTIGETYGSANYGIVSWTPSGNGTHACKVRVYDQQHNRPNPSFVDVEWTVTAGTQPADFTDNKGFIFVDYVNGKTVAEGGTGTYANPFKTSRDWYKDNPADTTYQGYHVIWLAGGAAGHPLYLDPVDGSPTNAEDTSGNGECEMANKPVVWYGLPGQRPIINFSQAKVLIPRTCDGYFSDLLCHHSRRQSSQHFFFVYSSSMTLNGTEAMSSPTSLGYRFTWWRNEFAYHYPSNFDRVNYPTRPNSANGNVPTAGENTGAVWAIGWSGSPRFRWFWYFADNEYRDISEYDPDTGLRLWSDNGVEAAQMTQTYYGLVERNRQTGKHESFRLGFHKSTCAKLCYRANEWWQRSYSFNPTLTVNCSQEYTTEIDSGNMEVCWNKIYQPGTSTNSAAIVLNDSAVAVENQSWVYRNTFHGGATRSAARTVQDHGIWENNIFITKDADIFYLTPATNQTLSVRLDPTTEGTAFDSNGNLIGTTAAQYRGIVGAEVA